MITVLEIIGELETGGAESQLVHIVTRLDRSLFRPVVASLTPGGYYVPALRDAGVEVIGLTRRGHFDATRVAALLSLIRRLRPALVHGHLFSAYAYSGIACRMTGTPHVVSALTSVLPPRGYRRRADRLLCRGAAAVLTNSRAMRDLLVGEHGLAEAAVRLIYNGLPDCYFSLDRAARGRTRAEMGLGERDVAAVLVATLSPEKDHATFLRALARTDPRLHGLFVGGGREEEPLRRLAAELGVTRRVRFVGMTSEVPRFLAASDLFVNCSRREGTSNALIEAMAAGLPAVATAVGGNLDFVEEDRTGFLVPPGDAQALAAALDRVARMGPDAAARLGQCGSALVRSRCSMGTMVRQVEAVYAQTAGGAA